MRLSGWVVPAAGLVLVVGLTACGTRTGAMVQQTAVPIPEAPTTSASPVTVPSTDLLADIDRQLATVDGAAAQSTRDLAAGDTGAGASDDGR